jgi:hypothetical protein
MKTLVERSKITHTSTNHTFPIYYYYIASSLLNRCISNMSLPSAYGAMRNESFKSQPCKSLFETRVSQYIGADFEAAIGIKLDLIIEPEAPCGGAWVLLGQLLNSHLAASRRGSKALFWLINRAALWMDKRLPDTEETIGWMCIAQAPSPSG